MGDAFVCRIELFLLLGADHGAEVNSRSGSLALSLAPNDGKDKRLRGFVFCFYF